MVTIGIDPGLDGGIAIIGEDTVEATVTPTIGTGKRKYDEQEMSLLLSGLAGNAVAYIEQAQPMAKTEVVNGRKVRRPQGITSTFGIGVGYGLWRGMLSGLAIPYEVVSPRRWQNRMFIGADNGLNTKAKSVMIAKRMFPDVTLLKSDRCRKEHHGMSDALLIAAYGRQFGALV